MAGIICAFITAPKWTRLSVLQAEKSSQLTGYIVDSTTNLSIVQQNVGWREELGRLDFAQEEMTETFVNRMRWVSWFWGTFDTVMTILPVPVSWRWSFTAGSRATCRPPRLAMTVGLSTNLFGAIAGTINLLSSKFDDIGVLQGSAAENIDALEHPRQARQRRELHVVQGAVDFRDVDFSYLQAPARSFSKLNLFIPAGQRVGLVGVSGAGKSSLCHLLLPRA